MFIFFTGFFFVFGFISLVPYNYSKNSKAIRELSAVFYDFFLAPKNSF